MTVLSQNRYTVRICLVTEPVHGVCLVPEPVHTVYIVSEHVHSVCLVSEPVHGVCRIPEPVHGECLSCPRTSTRCLTCPTTGPQCTSCLRTGTQCLTGNLRYRHFTAVCLFQFIVRARDQSYPEKLDTASVQVDIIRDQFAPVFSLQDYRVTIPETVQVNASLPFITVSASDRDLQVTHALLEASAGGRGGGGLVPPSVQKQASFFSR